MSFKAWLKLGLIVVFFALPSAPLFGDYDCSSVPPADVYDDFDSCQTGCTAPGKQCEPDIDPDTLKFCCVDVTSVPELPSWFGPFFLATVVAGWEYWRASRRRKVKVSSLKH